MNVVYVRFGSKADICVAKGHVPLPPKADMCSAQAHVRFGPGADIPTTTALLVLIRWVKWRCLYDISCGVAQPAKFLHR